MAKFKTCPDCGSNLDHGELCDCQLNPVHPRKEIDHEDKHTPRDLSNAEQTYFKLNLKEA